MSRYLEVCVGGGGLIRPFIIIFITFLNKKVNIVSKHTDDWLFCGRTVIRITCLSDSDDTNDDWRCRDWERTQPAGSTSLRQVSPLLFFFSIEFSDLILSTPKFNSANVVRAHKRHWSGKCIETIRLCGTEARNLVNCGTFNLDLFADGQ